METLQLILKERKVLLDKHAHDSIFYKKKSSLKNKYSSLLRKKEKIYKTNYYNLFLKEETFYKMETLQIILKERKVLIDSNTLAYLERKKSFI